jgi:predicted transcriptional regulator
VAFVVEVESVFVLVVREEVEVVVVVMVWEDIEVVVVVVVSLRLFGIVRKRTWG